MSVVVAYKYTTNPQDARVSDDGVVDWSRAKPSMSDYDPVAATLGRELANALSTELVGITVGEKAVGASMAKKNAMSKGFDRGIVVADDATAGWNPTQYASVLAQIVEGLGDVQVVLTGDSSIDNGARMTSALIGGFLDWPVFQDVEKIEPSDAGLRLTQLTLAGKRTVDVAGPVVVAATSDAIRVPVPSMKEILAAGKKPVEARELTEFAPAGATLDVTATAKPAARERKHEIFTGDSAVSDLLAALKRDGVL